MDLVYKAQMLTQGGRTGTVQSDDGSFKLKLAVNAAMVARAMGPTRNNCSRVPLALALSSR